MTLKLKRWNSSEDEWLKQNFTSLGIEKCVSFLSRTKIAIGKRAVSSGIRRRERFSAKPGYKFCPSCIEEKLIELFHKNKSFSSGYMRICATCCVTERREKRQVDPIYFWVYGTRSQHKQRGYDVRMTIQELRDLAEKAKQCIYCGKDLEWLNKKIKHNSPTLDTIDNEGFIDSGNSGICCYQCNSTKSNRTIKEFVEYMENTLKITKQLMEKGNYAKQ